MLLAYAMLAPAFGSPYIETPLTRLDCKLATPKATGKAYPGRDKIYPSNKVAIPPGKAVFASGEILYLMGRVYDQDCVPIEGASIELWQADARGEYRRISEGEWVSPQAAFAGTGRAVTNNIGEYQFITVFPGARGKEAPHINLRITHPDFPALVTKVYFNRERRNENDPTFKQLKSPRRELLLAAVSSSGYGLQGFFDIVLAGKNKYRQF